MIANSFFPFPPTEVRRLLVAFPPFFPPTTGSFIEENSPLKTTLAY